MMSGDIENGICDFCHEKKPVQRTYLQPSKYIKSKDPAINEDLHNEGDYFIIIWTCHDCGIPKM